MACHKQLALGAVANLGTVASGMALGFSAVALPAMQSPDNTPYVSDAEASWIASLTSLGMIPGCLLMGPLLHRLGRRRTLILVNTPAVLGWLLISTASHRKPWFLYQVYAGRLLTGLATGLVSIPAVVYVGEAMDRIWRGVLTTWPSIGVSLGILVVYVLGSLFRDNWRLVAGISICVPVISIIAVWFLLPESPVWLVSRGRTEEAEASMRLIRSVPEDTSLSESLQRELDVATSPEAQQDSSSSGWKETLGFLKRPEAYKPLLIMNAFFFFQQFSGIFVVIFYAASIVRDMGLSFDDYTATVLIGVFRFATSLAISYASKRCGRRLLCNISGVGTTLSIGALAAFLSLMRRGIIGPEAVMTYSWFPITALILSVMTGTLGFMTLPFAMLGEVFPLKVRGSACGLTTFMATTFSFLAVKLFPYMGHWMGYDNVFTLYTAVIAIGTVTMYVCLPETHGKTLPEIEDFFRSGTWRRGGREADEF